MGWRSVARESVARGIRYSGLPRALRWARRRRATIAFYHDPSPAVMEAHLRYLSARFAFTTLDAVVDAIRGGDWSGLPERALVLTFDDGHRGNHALLPLFRRYRVRPTIYVCTQVVATGRRFWFQEPVETARWKQLDNRARLAELRRATGFEQEAEYADSPRQALSREQMLEMAPHVDFQPHTRFHPILTRCTDEEAWEEVAGSKRDLEALLGRPCRHFSYPNGDYLERDVDQARKAGFDSARTVDVGTNDATTDPYRLRVMGLTDDASVDVLAAQLSGIPSYLRNLARGRFDGRKEPIRPRVA
jgi:peptidoglycan/xylan/chitin deacetylase (PgdA/CDA1 family)